MRSHAEAVDPTPDDPQTFFSVRRGVHPVESLEHPVRDDLLAQVVAHPGLLREQRAVRCGIASPGLEQSDRGPPVLLLERPVGLAGEDLGVDLVALLGRQPVGFHDRLRLLDETTERHRGAGEAEGRLATLARLDLVIVDHAGERQRSLGRSVELEEAPAA